MDPGTAAEVMIDAGLVPLVPYPGRAITPWPCRCQVCESFVSPSYNAVQQGKGCRVCAHRRGGEKQRLGQEEAVRRLRDAGAEPLEPYPGAFKPWQCRCQSCGRTVTPLLNNVSRGKGPCRWCGRLKQAAAKRIDPKLVEAALRVAGAEPVEPYPGRIDHPWRCQCTRCNRSIAPRPGVVMARGSDPCPYCSRVRMDPEEAVETMREAGVEPLDVYPGARHPWRCRCLRCGREVTPWFSSVRDGQGGCGFCVKNKLDPAEATERMRAAGIIPDGPYPGRRDRPWPGHASGAAHPYMLRCPPPSMLAAQAGARRAPTGRVGRHSVSLQRWPSNGCGQRGRSHWSRIGTGEHPGDANVSAVAGRSHRGSGSSVRALARVRHARSTASTGPDRPSSTS